MVGQHIARCRAFAFVLPFATGIVIVAVLGVNLVAGHARFVAQLVNSDAL